MGCAATLNGVPAARIAASYLASGYKNHVFATSASAVHTALLYSRPFTAMTMSTPCLTKDCSWLARWRC